MSVQLIEYTEKSIAVFGETEKIKDYLEKLGGKFNPGLTNKTTGSREAGWIFVKSKAKEVQKLVDGFNKGDLNKETSILDVMMNKPKTVIKSTGDFVITKEMYMALISRIEKLETDNMNLSKLLLSKKQPHTPSPTPTQQQSSSSSSSSSVKNRVSTPVESDDSEEEEEEEYPTTKKSFLNFK